MERNVQWNGSQKKFSFLFLFHSICEGRNQSQNWYFFVPIHFLFFCLCLSLFNVNVNLTLCEKVVPCVKWTVKNQMYIWAIDLIQVPTWTGTLWWGYQTCPAKERRENECFFPLYCSPITTCTLPSSSLPPLVNDARDEGDGNRHGHGGADVECINQLLNLMIIKNQTHTFCDMILN